MRILENPGNWKTRSSSRRGNHEGVEKILSRHLHIEGENPRREILSQVGWRFISTQEAEKFLDSSVKNRVLKYESQDMVDYLVHLHNLYLKQYNPARNMKFNPEMLSVCARGDREGVMFVENSKIGVDYFTEFKEPLLVTQAELASRGVVTAQTLLNQMEFHAAIQPDPGLGQGQMATFYDGKRRELGPPNHMFTIGPTNPWLNDFLAYSTFDYPDLSQEQFQEKKLELTADLNRWYPIVHRKNQLVTDSARDIVQHRLFERDFPVNLAINTLNTHAGRMGFLFSALIASNPERYRHYYLEARQRANLLFSQQTPLATQLIMRNEMENMPEIQQALRNRGLPLR